MCPDQKKKQWHGHDHAESLQRPGARTGGLGADFRRGGPAVPGRESVGARGGDAGYHRGGLGGMIFEKIFKVFVVLEGMDGWIDRHRIGIDQLFGVYMKSVRFELN